MHIESKEQWGGGEKAEFNSLYMTTRKIRGFPFCIIYTETLKMMNWGKGNQRLFAENGNRKNRTIQNTLYSTPRKFTDLFLYSWEGSQRRLEIHRKLWTTDLTGRLHWYLLCSWYPDVSQNTQNWNTCSFLGNKVEDPLLLSLPACRWAIHLASSPRI